MGLEISDMHTDEYLAQSVVNEQYLGEANWSQTVSNQSTQSDTPIIGDTPSNQELWLFPTGLAIIASFFATTLIVVWLKRLQYWKNLDNSLISHKTECFHQTACYQCRFFNNNPYLKCAVNPSTVLTPEAKNCPDYQPCQQKKSEN
ncbi:hypothetical protein IQ238_08295 [Pleurocapsales cyanobacterium LEGE 06147]|nr:hypothetical protein [Pleurocapsales cyanobacterium LEGE 06147]